MIDYKLEKEYLGLKSGKKKAIFICKTTKLSDVDKELVKKFYWRFDE